MKRWLGMLGAMLLLGVCAQAAVQDDSFKDAAGARVLKETVVVAAAPAEVWKAFTTDAAFKRWSGVPVVHITPGNGGLIEFGLSPTSKIGDPDNVRNRIAVYLPDRLLVWQNEFVPQGGPFDPATFATVRTLLAFDDQGDGTTKVSETVVGFGDGPKYDALYAHLRGGNAQYLAALTLSFQAKH